MKTLLTWVLMIASSGLSLGQTLLIKSTSDCAMATQRHIEQSMTIDQQLAIRSNPEQLAVLNYMYASSFTFSSEQMILKSQKALFNLDKYAKFRQQSCNTTVYDETSGLSVTLLSWDEVEKSITKIRYQYQTAECTAFAQ